MVKTDGLPRQRLHPDLHATTGSECISMTTWTVVDQEAIPAMLVETSDLRGDQLRKSLRRPYYIYYGST